MSVSEEEQKSIEECFGLIRDKANEFLKKAADDLKKAAEDDEAEFRKIIERDGPKKAFTDVASKIDELMGEKFDEYQSIKDTLSVQERKVREIELIRLVRYHTQCKLASEIGEKFEKINSGDGNVAN
jgi:hypothetical protein